MNKKPKANGIDPETEAMCRDILHDIRCGKPLAPGIRKLVADALEDKWFPPSNLKARERLQKNANEALAYSYLIIAATRKLQRSAKTPRGGMSDAATSYVAERLGLSVEAFSQRIKRGKKAAITLGMSVPETLKLLQENPSEAEKYYGKDIVRDLSDKGQI